MNPVILTLSLQMFLSYRNQSIDLLCKSLECFLYDRDLVHERVKQRGNIFYLCFGANSNRSMNFRYEDINFPSKQKIFECIISANAFMSLVFTVVFIIDFEKV